MLSGTFIYMVHGIFYFYKNASYNLAGILFAVALAKTTIKILVLSHLTIEQVVNNHDKQ